MSFFFFCVFCFFQAEDGIRDLVRSRGLGDVYKRQFLFPLSLSLILKINANVLNQQKKDLKITALIWEPDLICLLYTSDAADERSSVDLGGRRIIKKKKNEESVGRRTSYRNITRVQKSN